MHATTLIAQALWMSSKEMPVHPQTSNHVCCLTGQRTECVPRKELIGPSFTENHLFKAPASEWIGLDVFIAWRYGIRAAGKSRDMRPEANQCWFCDGKQFLIVRKPDMRKVVLAGAQTVPWAMWITTSYKKHGSLRAPVNTRERGRVGFDELVVDCTNEAEITKTWRTLNQALEDGIGRTVIETLDCPPFVMSKVGLLKWIDFLEWARPRYQSGLYKLATYLLPSQEERNNADV